MVAETLYEQLISSGEPFTIATYIITIFVILAGFAIGLGRSFGIRKLEEWGRNEIFQQLINAAFIAGLSAVVLFMGIIITDLTLESVGDPSSSERFSRYEEYSSNEAMDYSINYYDQINRDLSKMAGLFMILYGVAAPLSTLNIGASFVVTGSITPLNGLVPLLDIMAIVILVTTIFIFFTFALKALLLFVNGAAFNVLLPLGLILRSAYITRKVGGAIIAIAVGFYIVFPLLVILNVVSMDAALSEGHDVFNTTITGTMENVSSAGLGVSNVEEGEVDSNIEEVLDDEDRNIISKMIEGGIGIVSDLKQSVVDAQEVLAAYFVLVFIGPFFNLIITVISIKEMAQIFGSEINGGFLDKV